MMVVHWDEGIRDIIRMAEKFINESQQPVTYSEKNSIDYLWKIFNDPKSAIFVEYIGQEIAGGVIVSCDTEWHNEHFGYLVKLFVLPNARGTMVGRNLVRQAVEWFDAYGCVRSFATATAAIGQDKAFINLLGKYGYNPDGAILIRDRSTN